MIGKIKGIIGHIGPSYVDKGGLLHKGTVLLDVIEQVESLPEATTVIEVPINSPGGYADIGDDIYNYLDGKKKQGKQIVTIQTGLIGSIATKIFLAGDRRIVDDRYEFWIHNPFMDNVSGDQDELRAMAESLASTEKDLRKFYAEHTSIPDEGLDALMKQETGLTADQCLKFKFGTEKKLVPVFNSIKMNKPAKPAVKVEKKDEKSLLEKIKALFEDAPKGVPPKKKVEIPANPEPKNVVVTLADGSAFWIEAEMLAEGVGAFLLDESGQPTAEPLADGEYQMEDGSMVTVQGGVVTAVKPADDGGTEEMVSKAEAETMVKEAVEKALAEQKASLEQMKTEVLNFKKEVRLGKQPTAAYIKVPENDGKIVKMSEGINRALAKKREERQKQLNHN